MYKKYTKLDYERAGDIWDYLPESRKEEILDEMESMNPISKSDKMACIMYIMCRDYPNSMK